MFNGVLRVSMKYQLLRQDGQRLGLVVFIGHLLDPRLAFGIFPQEQHRSLAEGPLQEDIADLGAGGAIGLAGGLLAALDQATLGDEVLDPWKTLEIMDLIQNNQ